MAFFQRQLHNVEPESSFTPLFRLLSDFDNYSRQGPDQHRARRSALPSWQPKFDVRETGDNYELHGELAGMNTDDVHVEFTDPQTMLVRGRVERNYSSGTPPHGYVEDASGGRTITEGTDEAKQSHRATVEDDNESNDIVKRQKSGSDGGDALAEHKAEHNKSADHAKYWLTERSVGEFSRSFNFPTRIDQEAVSASFKDGILSITVPKVKKRESRRISIKQL